MKLHLTIATLNVLYEPKIGEDSPYHFNRRWAAIQAEIKGTDVIALQEVHESYLERIAAFAQDNGYAMAQALYHVPRQMHLVTLVHAPLLVTYAVHHLPGTWPKALSVQLYHLTTTYTVFNVHLPFDAQATGEREATTKAFLRAAAATKNAVIIGDWNTLPGRGDAQQLAHARLYGTVVPWDFGGAPQTTYWGFPHEAEELREYRALAVLDRLFVGPGLRALLAECRHRFMEIDGHRMAISDHMPCYAHVSS